MIKDAKLKYDEHERRSSERIQRNSWVLAPDLDQLGKRLGDTVKSLGVVAKSVCVAQRGETTAPENRHTMEMQLGHAQKDLKAQEEDVDAAGRT